MMTQGWTVWCDSAETRGRGCCAMDQVSGSRSSAAKEFKRSGWKRLRNGKWLCPECAVNSKSTTSTS